MFVGSVVVHDDVDSLAGVADRGFQAVEEAEEFLMAVPRLAATDHRAVEHVESGEQGGGAMPFVVMGLSLRKSRAKGQNRLRAVKSLNLALLVHAENEGLIGRIHVEADDVAHLGNKIRIGTELKVLETMRLELIGLPDSLYGRRAYALMASHTADGPMSGVLGFGVPGRFHDSGLFSRGHHTGATRTGLILQNAKQPQLLEATAP
jgi:hypothetical protein